MITLAPLKDKCEIESIFSQNGFEFNEYSGCVVANEKENNLGYCLYYLDNEKMTVLRVFPENDLMLADGILRSTLHVAAERSIMKAFYCDSSEPISKKLCFIKNESEKRLDIDKLFKSCCNCGE